MKYLRDRAALIATALLFGFCFLIVIPWANDALGLENGVLFKFLMTIGFVCTVWVIVQKGRKKRQVISSD